MSPAGVTDGSGDGRKALRSAVAAHLAWYKGMSRVHADADLRMYLDWCAGHGSIR
jgi:hypothetical protein